MSAFPMSAADLGIDHSLFDRVVVYGSGKGGVGKTTLTGNSSTVTAKNAKRTLAIDINGQGNLRRELGLGEGDEGAGFLDAMKNGTPLVPVKDVRPGLDVVIGGPKVRELNTLFVQLASEQGPYAAFLRLAQCLQPLLAEYDIVFIDAPPENPNLLLMCLCASRWLVVPVRRDVCSLDDALKDIAGAFSAAKQLNPLLELLGVVHFGSPSGSSRIHTAVIQAAERMLGANVHVFEETIHNSVNTASRAREQGKSVWELVAANDARNRDLGEAPAKLAEAHNNLLRAILLRMRDRRAQA